MSHLHVVDGVLPWWVVAATLLLAGLAVRGVLAGRSEGESVRFLARVGVTGAALIVAMSLPLGPGIHLSLAPLAGMMLGPGGGFLAAFLANGALATLGHGGLTALGLNGMFLGLQAVAGALLFRPLRARFGVRWGAIASAGVTLGAAAVVAVAALRALPLEEDAHAGPGHAEHAHGDEWGLVVVGILAVAAAAVETGITSSVLVFLARVRSDLVIGGDAPRPVPAGGRE